MPRACTATAARSGSMLPVRCALRACVSSGPRSGPSTTSREPPLAGRSFTGSWPHSPPSRSRAS
eukprot:10954788-Lingulodinium_polyedra.AAC.1